MKFVLRNGKAFLSPKVGRIQRSQLDSFDCALKAMYFPSRDQSVGIFSSGDLTPIGVSAPWPSAVFSTMSLATEYAMREPSGENTGQYASPVEKLKRELTLRTRSRTQMSYF